MSYFQLAEFACKCGKCAPRAVSPTLLDRLDRLRFAYGKPIVISSGVRCPEHNLASGGKADSEHLTGEAADVLCETAQDRYRMLSLAMAIFDRIGIDKRFLHLGVSPRHPQSVIWLY